MPDAGKQLASNSREKGHCPLCGHEADDITHLKERIENGEGEAVPGTHYDHSGDSPGTGACIEWADGETEQQ